MIPVTKTLSPTRMDDLFVLISPLGPGVGVGVTVGVAVGAGAVTCIVIVSRVLPPCFIYTLPAPAEQP